MGRFQAKVSSRSGKTVTFNKQRGGKGSFKLEANNPFAIGEVLDIEIQNQKTGDVVVTGQGGARRKARLDSHVL